MITYSAIYHSPVSILVLHSLICILIIPQLNFCKIFQDQNELKRKNAKLTDYYENLRSNVFSIFGTQNYADSYLGLHLMSNYGGWHETWICQLYEMTTPGSKAPIRGPEESGAPHEKVKQTKYSSVELWDHGVCFYDRFYLATLHVGHLLCPRWEQDILLGSRDRAGYNGRTLFMRIFNVIAIN